MARQTRQTSTLALTPPPERGDDLLTLARVIDEYQMVSERRLRGAVAAREVTHHRFGRRLLFRRSDIEEWLTRDRHEAI